MGENHVFNKEVMYSYVDQLDFADIAFVPALRKFLAGLYMHAYIRARVHTHTYTHMYTNVREHRYTHTHHSYTHSHTLAGIACVPALCNLVFVYWCPTPTLNQPHPLMSQTPLS